MSRLFAALRELFACIGSGFGRFWVHYLWPRLRAAGRAATEAAGATVDAAEWVGGAAVRTVGATASAVLSIRGRLFGGGGGGSGPRAPRAAEQTEADVRAAQVQAERQIAITQTAKLVHRAAAIKSNYPNRDLTDLLDALPGNLGSYMKALTGAEIYRLAEADVAALVSHLTGDRPVPGVRTVTEVFAPPAADPKVDGPARFRASSDEAETPEQSAMMGALADRIRARQAAQQPKSDLRYA